jgi:very-short-patch-repair endonuclease
VLRGRRLAGLKFRRQCLVAGFIVDFYCAELRLVLEIDGAAHERPERREYDRQRTATIERSGLRVLRIGNADVSEAGLRSLILPLTGPSPATRERGPE